MRLTLADFNSSRNKSCLAFNRSLFSEAKFFGRPVLLSFVSCSTCSISLSDLKMGGSFNEGGISLILLTTLATVKSSSILSAFGSIFSTFPSKTNLEFSFAEVLNKINSDDDRDFEFVLLTSISSAVIQVSLDFLSTTILVSAIFSFITSSLQVICKVLLSDVSSTKMHELSRALLVPCFSASASPTTGISNSD